MDTRTTASRWRARATATVSGVVLGVVLLVATAEGSAAAQTGDPYGPSEECVDLDTIMAGGGYECRPPVTTTPTTVPPTTAPPTSTTPPTTAPTTTTPPTTAPTTTTPPTTVPPTTVPPTTVPPTTIVRPGTPDVTATAGCIDTTSTLTLTLATTGGDLPVVFTVTHPVTSAVSAVTVPVGRSSTVALAALPSGNVAVAITADGVPIGRTFVVPPCVASLPAPPAPGTPSLPVTGNHLAELVLSGLAVAAVAAGAGLVRVGGRRRRDGHL